MVRSVVPITFLQEIISVGLVITVVGQRDVIKVGRVPKVKSTIPLSCNPCDALLHHSHMQMWTFQDPPRKGLLGRSIGIPPKALAQS